MLTFIEIAMTTVYTGGMVITGFLMAYHGAVSWWESVIITLLWPLVLAFGLLRSHAWED